MYLYPLELFPIREGLDDGCQTIGDVFSIGTGTGTGTGTPAPNLGIGTSGGGGGSGGSSLPGVGGGGSSTPSFGSDSGPSSVSIPGVGTGGSGSSPPPVCINKVNNQVVKSIEELIETIQGQLNALKDVLDTFVNVPREWTFNKQIKEAQDLLDDTASRYNSSETKSYEIVKDGFTKLNEITRSIRSQLEKYRDMLINPNPRPDAAAKLSAELSNNIQSETEALIQQVHAWAKSQREAIQREYDAAKRKIEEETAANIRSVQAEAENAKNKAEADATQKKNKLTEETNRYTEDAKKQTIEVDALKRRIEDEANRKRNQLTEDTNRAIQDARSKYTGAVLESKKREIEQDAERKRNKLNEDTKRAIEDANDTGREIITKKREMEQDAQSTWNELTTELDSAKKRIVSNTEIKIEQIKEDAKNKYDALTDKFIQSIQDLNAKVQSNISSIQEGARKQLDKAKEELTAAGEKTQGFFSDVNTAGQGQMNIVAAGVIRDGTIILDGIDKFMNRFKNDKGLISVDLLSAYDDAYQSSGIPQQNAFLKGKKDAATADLAKSTEQSADLMKAAQNPGFFMSILESILYNDPTSNPNYMYANKTKVNPQLEQVRQMLTYAIYGSIVIAIMFFLSTKTFVLPFLHTFIFWFKRYFVFIAWIVVVSMIYVFMTEWFTWLMRENVRYIAFMLNPLLHPGVNEIWRSKYKMWIKLLVAGLASMCFFLATLLTSAVVLFLIAPIFLLLLWASGQLMSYFEKEEMDE